jgi:hypothetical protein
MTDVKSYTGVTAYMRREANDVVKIVVVCEKKTFEFYVPESGVYTGGI